MIARAAPILLVAVAMLLGGCSTSGARAPSTRDSAPSTRDSATTSAALSPAAQRCGLPRAPSKAVTVRTTDGLTLPAYETGSGPRGVVLVHETGAQALCGWWPYAAHLAAANYRALIVDLRCYGKAPCPTGSTMNRLTTDVTAAVAALRRDGARSVVLVGASLGGSVVLAAAAEPAPGVTAVASLSGDLFDQPMSSASPPLTDRRAAPRIRIPVLFALAEGDPLVSVAQAKDLVAQMPATNKRVLVLAASYGHGWEMLVGSAPGSWSPFDQTLRAYISAHTT